MEANNMYLIHKLDNDANQSKFCINNSFSFLPWIALQQPECPNLFDLQQPVPRAVQPDCKGRGELPCLVYFAFTPVPVTYRLLEIK